MAESNASFTFHNQVTGGSNQLNQGNNVTATQHVTHGSDMSLEQFFGELSKQLQAVEDSEAVETRPETTPVAWYCDIALELAKQAEQAEQADLELGTGVLVDLTAYTPVGIAQIPKAEVPAEVPAEVVLPTLLGRIKQYGPLALKGLLAFSCAALQSAVASNPIAAGVIAAIQQVQADINNKA